MTVLQSIAFVGFMVTVALILFAVAEVSGIVKGWVEGDDE